MKPPHAIEVRALALAEALQSGAALTDPFATSFRKWPGPTRSAARRLAGCANAARGRDLLWLVGVDSAGAAVKDAAEWIARVSGEFDGVAPRIEAFAIPLGGARKREAVALHIETVRAPFVVRRAGGGFETPWFDGAAVRSAARIELVQLLSPLQDLPAFEILEAELSFYKNPHVSAAARETFRWTLDATVYTVPQGDARVVIPLHRCRGGVRIAHSGFRSEAADVSLTADKGSPAVRVTDTAALIEGLGRLFIYCCGSTREADPPLQNAAEILLDFTPAGSHRAALALAALRPEPPIETNQAGRWKL